VAASILGETGLPRLVLAAAMFLAGGFGVRLLGLPRLLRQARADATGLHAFVGLTIAMAIGASLSVRAQPMAVDGIQFLMLALYLSWLYAGPALAGCTGRRAWLAVPLAALALVPPVTSLARKMAPSRFTRAGSLDRVRVTLRPATLAACAWLRERTDRRDRVLLPLDGDPEDVGGMKPLLVAALAQRRVAAFGSPTHVAASTVRERREWARRVYEATEAAAVQDAQERLGAQWIWEDAVRPVRAAPAGWTSQPAATGIRLLSTAGAGRLKDGG
jgi:hypothetical protein